MIISPLLSDFLTFAQQWLKVSELQLACGKPPSLPRRIAEEARVPDAVQTGAETRHGAASAPHVGAGVRLLRLRAAAFLHPAAQSALSQTQTVPDKGVLAKGRHCMTSRTNVAS